MNPNEIDKVLKRFEKKWGISKQPNLEGFVGSIEKQLDRLEGK